MTDPRPIDQRDRPRERPGRAGFSAYSETTALQIHRTVVQMDGPAAADRGLVMELIAARAAIEGSQ